MRHSFFCAKIVNMTEKIKTININAFYLAIAAVVLAVVAFALLEFFEERAVQIDETDIVEIDYSKNCETGQWSEFAPLGENPVFPLTTKINAAGGKFTSADGLYQLKAASDFGLDFFVGKDVELAGVKTAVEGKEEVAVYRIKCSGAEARPEVVASRRQIMRHVAGNINTLAPAKPSQGRWQADGFYFVRDNDFYVKYSSEVENDEEYFEDGLLLLRAAGAEGNFKISRLAYVIPAGENEAESRLVEGEDIYKDEKNLAYYEYDDESEEWVLAE